MKGLSVSVFLFLVLVLFVTPVVASGSPIFYDNGQPLLPNFVAGSSDLDLGPLAGRGDDFLVSEAVFLTDIHWWGIYIADPEDTGDYVAPDSFSFWIYPFLSGVPDSGNGVQLVSTNFSRVDTNTVLTGFIGNPHLFQYSADVAPFRLDPGTYLIVIANDTSGDPDDWYWMGSTSPGSGTNYFEDPQTGSWGTSDYDLALQSHRRSRSRTRNHSLARLRLAGSCTIREEVQEEVVGSGPLAVSRNAGRRPSIHPARVRDWRAGRT